MDSYIILILIGVVAGVLSGMFGIGGGGVIVPSLILFLGFTQKQANGTSLAALLLPVGVLACISYYRAGKLKIGIALMVALGLASGTWFGATWALDLPADILRQTYGVFLLYMAWRYISPRKWWAQWRGKTPARPADTDTEIDPRSPRILITTFVIGIVAGVLSGLFGIGGGVVIVPALMVFLSLDLRLATGTSLGALLLPVGLPGVLAYASEGQVDLVTAAPLAIMLLLGAIIGARVALGLPTVVVRRLYGLFLLATGLRFLMGM